MPFLMSWKQKNTRHTSLDRRLLHAFTRAKKPSLKQLKYLPRILSRKEYLFVRVLVGVIIVNLVFLGWRTFTATTQVIAEYGGTYTEGLVGSPQYINPLFAQGDADRDLSSLVYSGLLRYTVDRKLVGDLAQEYSISPDGKTYRFTLREKMVWHDGSPLTAEDVVFTVAMIQDSKSRSPLAVSFKDVRVEKIDDRTIQFVLSKPFAPFLDLATTGILPRHIWSSLQPENLFFASSNVRPVGSGAWKFHSLKKDADGTIRSYTFSRNENYFGEKPYLEKLVFKFYPDSDTAIQALKNRHVDGISFLPRILRDRLTKDKNLRYYTFYLPQYTAIFFNKEANGDLASKAVRQALALAINRDQIISTALAGEAAMIDGPIPRVFLGYHECLKGYDYDPGKAEGLLKTAGWLRDEEGFYKNEKKETKKSDGSIEKEIVKHRLTVRLTTVQRPEHASVVDSIAKNWQAIGVTVQTEFVDPSLVKSEVIDTRAYQTFLYGAIIGADPDLYPFWHSSQIAAPGLNLSQFSNSKADTLLEEGRHLIDTAERAKRYKAFQEIIHDELPAIFLYSPTYNYVLERDVQGIADGKQLIHAADRFVDLSHWYIKTKRTGK